jgi:hypothetical protein
MADETLQTIKVLPGPEAVKQGKVALWERYPAHPDGEVWVAADAGELRGMKPRSEPEPVEVAETAAVLAALAEGRLIRAEEAERSQRHASAAEDPKAGRGR